MQTCTEETLSHDEHYDKIWYTINGFFDNVKVLGPATEEKTWLPIAEIHRPKIDGCVASLQRTSTRSEEYSMSVKVFGIGGGVSKSRKFGIRDTIESRGDCLQVVLPLIVKREECMSGTEKFTRVSVEDIGQVPHAIELSGTSDGCGLDEDKVRRLGWETQDIPVPKKTTQQRDISLEAGQGAEISLQFKIGSIEIGPKASVKYLKETECSYTLVGPHKYLAYLPKNNLAYHWAWS